MKEIKKLGIAGLGLMGGSFMLSLMDKLSISIYDIDEQLKQKIKKDYPQIHICETSEELFGCCDVILICLNPTETYEFVAQNVSHMQSGCIVADITGVKGELYQKIKQLIPKDVTYVPTHPMAGRESMGFEMAVAGLFKGCNFIVCERNEAIEDIAHKLEVGKIVYCDIQTHDSMIAYTSQLPHILALSYVNTMEDRQVLNYAAGSFRDVSRVANINAAMWAELFVQNKEHLVLEIQAMEDNMRHLRTLVEREDKEALMEHMAETSKKLRLCK